jgi:hypothetical protein
MDADSPGPADLSHVPGTSDDPAPRPGYTVEIRESQGVQGAAHRPVPALDVTEVLVPACKVNR